ncbi:HEXXH motif domain-containing protein [Streptomyces sp. NBC_01498]|uniref:HEXXH motif domain-containing protein n=1 Tax=Streptomyces sp. NBC_01498 TaxID=2975870 RepID=UPI002E7B5869|nr:HEXXH motif domain-containing protein [Streptomyces sp. NBC_01498]WTL28169.1 HEXXH motif domain-containing protein [Streptomyces sp. NBC_01498]
MTLSPYRVTGALFDRIAAGGGGAEAVGVLAGSEHSRRLVLLRAVVARAEEWGGAPGAEARRARSVLSAARRTAPAVVRELLCRPSTGLGLLHCLRAFDAGGDAPSGPAGYPQSGSPYPYPCPSPEPLTALSAAAVVRTGLARTVALPVRDEGVLLPATGLARFPGARDGDTALVHGGPEPAVEVAGRRTRVPARPWLDGADWFAVRRLAVMGDRESLLLDDLDPYAFPSGQRAPRLTERQYGHWRTTVREGLRLLGSDHPETAAEAARGLRTLVPLRSPGAAGTSCSSAEAFGCVALSTPATAHAAALAITHETQHGKLSALLHLFDFFETDDPTARYYAPWRGDPRPVSGLLQGVYAFLGVAQFWNRCRSTARGSAELHTAQLELARWRDAVRIGVDQLADQLTDRHVFTATGRRFVAGMRGALGELAAQRLPVAVVAQARDLAADHRRRWVEANGAVPGTPERAG